VGNSGGSSDNNTVVTNNLFAHNQDYGFRDDSGTTGPNNKYNNNLTFNNGDGTYVVNGGTVNGNISSDPKFISYTGTALGNYKLQRASPAINSGTTLNAPNIDLDGSARPVAKGYDIGCYEYGAAPGTWPCTDVEDSQPPSTSVRSFFFPGTRLEQVSIELEQHALFTIPVIELASRLPPAASHSLGLGVVAEQVFHRTRNRLRILRIDQ